MATLVLSAIGTVFGGPLGGALGALIGRQVDSTIIGNRRAEGARLKELSVQTSSYGSPLPVHFGRIRTSGSVIWATELVEHSEKSGGGKGRPSVTSYSYTASFAVALASRPIIGVGRIWADGNLLRGAAGDLKVGGTLRVYTGHGDQTPDPLIVQAEGATMAPACRNLAYAVFEDLQLADYGNRLPSLTFEIIADNGDVSIADMIGGMVPEADSTLPDDAQVTGFTMDQGTIGDAVATLAAVYPLTCRAVDRRLSFSAAEPGESGPWPMLPPPAAGNDSAQDARAEGWSRRRESLPTARQCAVRYYDTGRDFQPGLQRSIGRSGPGDIDVIELPAAMSASQARALADQAARRSTLARDVMRYRISEIDPQFAPGTLVRVPVSDGLWRIEQWEWQADGVMLDLARVPATPPAFATTDAGRSNQARDQIATPTTVYAFELPWTGEGDGNTPAIRVAASSQGDGWTGAALYAERDGAELVSLGSTGRRRAIIGTTQSTLGIASPLLFDSRNVLDVELESNDFVLGSITWNQLMQGANTALVGSEIVQFAQAERIGPRQWRLSGFLRGRGGTETSVANHQPAEPFVLLDERIVTLDPAATGDSTRARVVAIGLADTAPATTTIANPGLTLRPLSPVHVRVYRQADGGIVIDWVRRARGSWLWLDEVDAPINESAELWEIAFTAAGGTQIWQTGSSHLEIPAEQAAGLAADGHFSICQVGHRSKSLPGAVPFPA